MARSDDSKKEELASSGALIAMIAILVALILVAIYANWQQLHRDEIETMSVTRITPEPSASATPTP